VNDQRSTRARRACASGRSSGGKKFKSGDRRRGVEAAQLGENQVPGLGGLEHQSRLLDPADLADHDHVRRLAQRVGEPLDQARRVGADLALVDGRGGVAVEELDRVLDGHDVTGPLGVELGDQRGQRRSPPRAGRAVDEHQPGALLARFAHHLGQVELGKRRDVVRDRAQRDGKGAALGEDRDPEAGDR
jgi:hypothetical protein